MADLRISTEILRFYPSLTKVEPSLHTLPPTFGPHSALAGTVLFSAGAWCQGFPLLLAGEIKVVQQSADGRSLELYRVCPGELCLVSSASLFQDKPLLATGISSRDCVFMLAPITVFSSWLNEPGFRAEVLGLFAQRLTDLTVVVDAVAFQKLDRRLAAALLSYGPELLMTHQALADQLGTVREVITRLLRRLEQQGYVALSREHIQIIDNAGLSKLANG